MLIWQDFVIHKRKGFIDQVSDLLAFIKVNIYNELINSVIYFTGRFMTLINDNIM